MYWVPGSMCKAFKIDEAPGDQAKSRDLPKSRRLVNDKAGTRTRRRLTLPEAFHSLLLEQWQHARPWTRHWGYPVVTAAGLCSPQVQRSGEEKVTSAESYKSTDRSHGRGRARGQLLEHRRDWGGGAGGQETPCPGPYVALYVSVMVKPRSFWVQSFLQLRSPYTKLHFLSYLESLTFHLFIHPLISQPTSSFPYPSIYPSNPFSSLPLLTHSLADV